MKLHEYQSKTNFSKYGLPIPKGRVATTAQEAKQIAEELGGRVVVKSQVLVVAREKLGSTGLGQGIAIPHGRIKGLKTPIGAFCRLVTPVQFDAPDGKPVGLNFVLLVPEAATQRHLEILSEIAELLSDRDLREKLKTEQDAEKVHELISRWEPLKSVA